MGVTAFEYALEQHENPFIVGTRREIFIVWPKCCNNFQKTPIELQVQNIKPFDHLRFHHGDTQTIRCMLYDSFYDSRVPDSCCAIVADSMPSFEILYDCCLDAGHFCGTGPFTPLHISFGKFAQRYCDVKEKLPLVRMLISIRPIFI